jgi:5-oxopent-3-ene-1,2,5-tricarboxylate decarboxylase / 2-hydroxyhepta-2,4-diene-1,7-dioate isomerase
MRLCHARQNGERFVALGDGERWIDLSRAMNAWAGCFPWPQDPFRPSIEAILLHEKELLGSLSSFLGLLDSWGALGSFQVDAPLDLMAPLTAPSKILALGLNYRAHADEVDKGAPKEPIVFAKAPSSIVGPGADIVYPPAVGRLDPEVELGAVIGRKAKNVSAEEAMEYVAGYVIVNDVTARDMQARDMAAGLPWFRSKSFDTFTPVGPWLVLKDEIPDPHNLRIRLRVNGQVRQDSSTAFCLFRIPEIVQYLSSYMTLEPGDLIAMGTPAGIAPLDRGDVVECSIDGLGTLTNRVI